MTDPMFMFAAGALFGFIGGAVVIGGRCAGVFTRSQEGA